MARPISLCYGFAICTFLIALVLSTQIPAWQDRDILMFMLIAVIASTWYGGLGPGVAATFLGAVATMYLFLPPTYSFDVAAREDLLQVGAFVGVAIVISWFIASRKQSIAALRASEARVKDLNEALEQRVMERTTELENANRSLTLRTKELIKSSAELERFAYASSHDLQEPVRTIKGFLHLLEQRYKGRLDSGADEFIAYAVDGAHRMERLIHDLLAYFQVGPRQQRMEQVDCEAAWNQAVVHVKAAIEQSHAIVTHAPLPTITGDARHFVQLFHNLIDNALKFRSQHPPVVHMAAERMDTDWLFAIKDNGIGIESQYAEQIFIAFQRLHTRADYPGTGYGASHLQENSRKPWRPHLGRIAAGRRCDLLFHRACLSGACHPSRVA